jgi:1,4-alpha-glucan branching enzyme
MPAKKVAKTPESKVKETFQLKAPDAESVMLAGDFTDWENSAKKMRKLKSGAWKTTVSLDGKKMVQYRFLVDGQWVDDPECQDRIPNGFGGENCLRQTGE